MPAEAPPCDHEICSADAAWHRAGNFEESPWACASGNCALEWLTAQCELTGGHGGEHEYPPRTDPKGYTGVDLRPIGGPAWPRPTEATP
jgi:hypothetical protein